VDWARLKKISLFEEISDEELQRFAVLAGEGSVHEGTELVHQGDFACARPCPRPTAAWPS